MEFQLSENEKMIKDLVEDFASVKLADYSNEIEATNNIPTELFHEMGIMDLFRLLAPEQMEGLGKSLIDYVLTVEALSSANASLGWSYVSTMSVSSVIMALGTSEQKSTYLPELLSGKKIGAFAFNEPGSGTNWKKTLKTKFTENSDGYTLSGSKALISNASIADIFVVIARSDDSEFSAFIVEKGSEGFSVGKEEQKLGLNGDPVGALFMDNCRIPDTHLLGEKGGIMKIIGVYSRMNILGQAAVSLGISGAALKATKKYIKERKVGDSTLIAFENVKRDYSDLHVKLHAAKHILYSGTISCQKPGPNPNLFMSNTFTIETGLVIVDQAMKLFGGHSAMKDYPVERYYRDSKTIAVQKTSEHLKEAAGRMLLENP